MTIRSVKQESQEIKTFTSLLTVMTSFATRLLPQSQHFTSSSTFITNINIPFRDYIYLRFTSVTLSGTYSEPTEMTQI